MPRSHSLPNMTWNEDHNDDSLNDDDSLDGLRDDHTKNEGAWEYKITRDFRGEIENYLTLKATKQADGGKKKKAPKEEKLDRGMHERGPLATENISLKICDLGNGCWTHHHFTGKI